MKLSMEEILSTINKDMVDNCKKHDYNGAKQRGWEEEAMKNETAFGWRIRDMVYMALFAVIIAVCAWISVPAPVPFTMQTFGVFAAIGILGGKRGTGAVLLYLLMGAVGLPVFSGFTGGVGRLMGTTGGYIVGFLFSALLMWGMEKLWGTEPAVQLLSMVLGLLVCYAFGTMWFMAVYARTTGEIGLWTALLWCVIPYLIPDGLKIALAMVLSRRLRPFVKERKKAE